MSSNSNVHTSPSVNASCTNQIPLHQAMLNTPLTYDPTTRKLHISDGYFINSLHLNGNMELNDIHNVPSTKPEYLTPKTLEPTITNTDSYQESSSATTFTSNDISDQITNKNNSSQDAEDLELCVDSSKRFGLTELFNKAVSAFVAEGSFRKKGWSIWNKNGNQVVAQKYSHVIASSTALIQQIRPSTLPAKDINEETRHKAEYDSILKEARIKERREQSARQNELKDRAKREEAQAKRVKQWQEILPKFSKMQHHQSVRSLWWQGLPPCIRGHVWFMAFGNDLKLTHEDYYTHVCKAGIKIALNLGCSIEDIIKISNDTQEDKIYQLFAASDTTNIINTPKNMVKLKNNDCDKGKENDTKITCSLSKSKQNEEQTYFHRNEHKLGSKCDEIFTLKVEYLENSSDACLNIIQLDISRTFPSLGVFQRDCPYYPILHALLASYVTYKPDVGYVQGMSFIAAVLLLNMEPPNAFIAFCNILEKPLHSAAFCLDQREMEAYFRAYDELLSHCLPVLHAHFMELGLSAELYCVDWLYSVYSRAMPFDVACRVWDLFARDGEEALFQTAIGILSYFQSTLLEMDFITAAQFLTKLPENINQDNLFRHVRKVQMKISQTPFKKLLSSYKAHV